ncbi:dual specificity protein phosphatase family protein [Aspergillus ibericus CBS 121593]|uniref:Phosphatases II n=1 Tax=Aspergillus ibericus CBS 121593 TaxID=1448316 RepID=A0A395GSS2_9EURO|nr:phosphatases II [Aspergillus ibericus CBS 121593]RAK98630.1 phosphatases II [Aspergillus ibericus CBS 121593]
MSQRTEVQYAPTQQYNSGTRIFQQPIYASANFEQLSFHKIKPTSAAAHQFQEGEFVPLGFFDKVDPALFKLPAGEVEWLYEKRRTAQQILPFLYLGPWSCLSERDWLNQDGITLLLAVRDRRLAVARLVSGEKAAADLGIVADSVDIQDYQELITALPQAICRINEHIASSAPLGLNGRTEKKVLVFCETGNGSSVLVVVAYLMVMLNLGVAQALQVVQSQRFCIDVDESATQLLLAFEAIINAKRDVERVRRASSLDVSVPPKKRSHDRDTDENDVDEYMAVDETRKPSAPFQDRPAY